MRKNCLYIGKVFHARHQPFAHQFTYKVFTLWADLDDLESLNSSLKLFSLNKWNVLSFYNKDHGPRDGSPLRPWIESAARDIGIDLTGGKIFFLGFPRLWGFVFNPISIFYCYDRAGILQAILYQVKNTFGQQHGYMIPVEEKTDTVIAQTCKKVFHVSPFIGMDCTYNFRLMEPDDRLDVGIHQFQANGKILTATWNGNAHPLTDLEITKAVLTHPLMTLKVVLAIHWEALRLWIKGAKYIPKPALPDKNITG